MVPTPITERLLKNETVLWSGRPGQGLRLTGQDALLIPFSLLWGGFAIFWEMSVMRTPAPFFFRLWGVPFVLVGLYMIAGRFLFDAWLRARIHYAVTNQRILIIRTGPFGNLTALARTQLGDLRLSERANGRGTIRFGQQPVFGRWGGMTSLTPALDRTPQFIDIENARRVFDQIQVPAPGKV